MKSNYFVLFLEKIVTRKSGKFVMESLMQNLINCRDSMSGLHLGRENKTHNEAVSCVTEGQTDRRV